MKKIIAVCVFIAVYMTAHAQVVDTSINAMITMYDHRDTLYLTVELSDNSRQTVEVTGEQAKKSYRNIKDVPIDKFRVFLKDGVIQKITRPAFFTKNKDGSRRPFYAATIYEAGD